MPLKRPGVRSRVAIIGVPMDLGANLRGVDMGPSAIRIASVVERLRDLGCKIKDYGNVAVPHASAVGRGPAKMRFAASIQVTCQFVASTVEDSLAGGYTPVVLGGDHSIAIGTVAGLARFGRGGGRRKPRKYGLIWVDAHADINTPRTTLSGNVHGMPLAVALGMGDKMFTELAGLAPMVDPANAVLLAVRSIDELERENLRTAGLRVMTMREIDERGVSDCMSEAIEIVTDGTDGFHVSFDIDSLDPRWAPGVGTPVAGGITVREAHLVMEMVADSRQLASLEMVEVNPVIDERNTTAELAAWLIRSALGGRIF